MIILNICVSYKPLIYSYNFLNIEFCFVSTDEKACELNLIENGAISWTKFCKTKIDLDSKFTFWDWFYSVTTLIRDHLTQPWLDGRIVGFVNKIKTEQMLSKYPTGTFILRFSDSKLGKVLSIEI